MILLLGGLVSQLLYKDYLNFFNHSLINIPVLLFFAGLTTSILAMLGLVGVCLNHRVLLTANISVMVFTLSLEVVGCLSFYHYQDTVSLFLHHQLLSGLGIFNNPDYRGVTETWNVAQHEAGRQMRNIFLMGNIFQLGCCGVRWYKDWDMAELSLTNLTHLGLSAHSVPDSCCRADVVGCGRNILNLSLEEVSNILTGAMAYFATPVLIAVQIF